MTTWWSSFRLFLILAKMTKMAILAIFVIFVGFVFLPIFAKNDIFGISTIFGKNSNCSFLALLPQFLHFFLGTPERGSKMG